MSNIAIAILDKLRIWTYPISPFNLKKSSFFNVNKHISKFYNLWGEEFIHLTVPNLIFNRIFYTRYF